MSDHATSKCPGETGALYELPIVVGAIGKALFGLIVDEDLCISEMLLPAERRIWLSAGQAARAQVAAASRAPTRSAIGSASASKAAVHLSRREQDIVPVADRRLEREANVFAAELLMPEPDVRTPCARAPEVNLTSARLGVAPTAAYWRMYDFDPVETRRGGKSL